MRDKIKAIKTKALAEWKKLHGAARLFLTVMLVIIVVSLLQTVICE